MEEPEGCVNGGIERDDERNGEANTDESHRATR
jgi:hypothetical protein